MGELTCFVPDAYTYTSFQQRYDSNGKVFINAIAGDTLTAKTPVGVIYNEYGAVTLALADTTLYYRVGVPIAGAAADASVWLQHGGYITDVVTASITTVVGYGIEIHDGTVALVSVDYSGVDAEFAVCTEVSGASTTHELMLVPRQILSST